MPDSNKSLPHVIGCDVAKREIVVFDTATQATRAIANTPAALDAFAHSLDPDCLVVCEATGGYESALLAALLAHGRPAHRACARRVKAFIRSHGIQGKSDAIDARWIARYGTERHDRLARWAPVEAWRDQLRAMAGARRDLVCQRTAMGNRLKAPGAQAVAQQLRTVIAALDKAIGQLAKAMTDLVRRHTMLEATVQTLRSIPGVGPVTALELTAFMPELGTLSSRQAAALAGLAPHPRQSGNREGYRRTCGGRQTLKPTLFMAALSAARHHPQLAQFNQRLRANGKKPIVAITATMRNSSPSLTQKSATR
ncbi:transposase [Novosphingobium sp. Rr 2-17]|uniref:IS110 family transposase n=1 Tax=Novosphingobium sp. Rr 2-17 TaxID=555793 RepID=UPI0002698BE9|nr:IS110 family transposase [Novosphingobium sp. Rr 2-17]EIZ78119.1 transposase [Novosphingobium sp. Rr 2-17]